MIPILNHAWIHVLIHSSTLRLTLRWTLKAQGSENATFSDNFSLGVHRNTSFVNWIDPEAEKKQFSITSLGSTLKCTLEAQSCETLYFSTNFNDNCKKMLVFSTKTHQIVEGLVSRTFPNWNQRKETWLPARVGATFWSTRIPNSTANSMSKFQNRPTSTRFVLVGARYRRLHLSTKNTAFSEQRLYSSPKRPDHKNK